MSRRILDSGRSPLSSTGLFVPVDSRRTASDPLAGSRHVSTSLFDVNEWLVSFRIIEQEELDLAARVSSRPDSPDLIPPGLQNSDFAIWTKALGGGDVSNM